MAEEPNLWSFMSEDLLLEILIRLPHARSAVRCRIVSKRWGSLLNSDSFRTRFHSQKHNQRRYLEDSSYALPYTLIFKFDGDKDMVFAPHELHQNQRPGWTEHYLDFLPDNFPSPTVETSCRDLLVVSSRTDGVYSNFGVCNPLTGEWDILTPNIPVISDYYLIGLWHDPDQSAATNPLGRFKVFFLWTRPFDGIKRPVASFTAAIFCSESRRWRRRELTIPAPLPGPSLLGLKGGAVQATSNGVMYFPATRRMGPSDIQGFVALDPLRSGESHFRYIALPRDYGVPAESTTRSRFCFGEVRGRLRLAQLKRAGDDAVDLRVWELSSDDRWFVVGKVDVECHRRNSIILAALHPNNGDVIFVMINNWICKYDIGREKYEKIGEISNEHFKGYKVHYFLRHVVSLLHTSWN